LLLLAVTLVQYDRYSITGQLSELEWQSDCKSLSTSPLFTCCWMSFEAMLGNKEFVWPLFYYWTSKLISLLLFPIHIIYALIFPIIRALGPNTNE
jgi:hypothetical protein